MTDDTLADLVARLERERLDADRLYNDALTALDRALNTPASLPDPPPAYDAASLERLNAGWDILLEGPPPSDRSITGRLRSFVWQLAGPPLDAQRQFNATLVAHLNANARTHAATADAMAHLIPALRQEIDAVTRFHSLLLQYLQTITVYVDSKDRSLGGSELRERLALTEQRMMAIKRELDRQGQHHDDSGAAQARGTAPAAPAFSGHVDSVAYVGFEDRFRGSQDDIRARVSSYLPLFSSASDIVDIGCGRGELLDLLRQQGVSARGVDSNHAMVELCLSRGLRAEQGDALGFLETQHDGSVGGLVAVQVVEHFEAAYLVRFLETAFHKMRPGAPLVLETINPACWMAFFETYIRDLTHRHPLHPDTLRYLVQASGFTHVDVQFRSPVSDDDRLSRVADQGARSPDLAGLTAVLNDHADKLNRRLFSSMDYVVVARR